MIYDIRFIPFRHDRKDEKAQIRYYSNGYIKAPNLTFPRTVDDFLIGSSFQYLMILHQKVIYKSCSWEFLPFLNEKDEGRMKKDEKGKEG